MKRGAVAEYGKPFVRLAPALIACAALLLAAGCEMKVDKETGRQTTNITIPGTAAHGFRMEDRWNRCMEFHSASYCQRRHRAARPPAR